MDPKGCNILSLGFLRVERIDFMLVLKEVCVTIIAKLQILTKVNCDRPYIPKTNKRQMCLTARKLVQKCIKQNI